MKHEFDEIDYENSSYEPDDIWGSLFDPVFDPPQENIDEWNSRNDDCREVPEPTLENTAVHLTVDNEEYMFIGKTIIPISEHFADSGKTVGNVIEDVIHYAVRNLKK